MGKAKRHYGRPYTLYPKKQRTGIIYYVEFRLPNGKFGTAKSTGQRTRGAAETWAINYLRSGQVVEKSKIYFKNFTENFFDPDGDYALNKYGKNHDKKRLLIGKQSQLSNHLIPFFGKSKLTDVDYQKIEQFKASVSKLGRNGDTINSILQTLREIMREAYKMRYIQAEPIIDFVPVECKKRGVLTNQEVVDLFKLTWGNFSRDILNEKSLEAYVGNLIAATTGLRQGEIISLRKCCVFREYLDVNGSWDNILHRLKTTKTGKGRVVPIPIKVYQKILKVVNQNTWQEEDSFIFQGDRKDRPMNPEILVDAFYESLEKIGIKKEERKNRNIVFHSWRHWFNSLLVNEKIPTFKVQALTGHSSDRMTSSYYHPDDFQDVREIQEKILIK